ncbi:MAG: dihydroneopterin aldolase [Actinomycetota bacterium]|nr:dihydroneopterin aldolase [Actinomycetota bacterium]
MTDVISLRGLTVRGYHGVHEVERARGQEFVVDVALEVDLARAAATDDLSDTVHYGELAEKLAEVISGKPVQLIETLAGRLVEVCLADPKVQVATVTVHKPHAPLPVTFADVAVTVVRTRP